MSGKSPLGYNHTSTYFGTPGTPLQGAWLIFQCNKTLNVCFPGWYFAHVDDSTGKMSDLVILSGWWRMRLAMSKLKYVILWKDHITADRQNGQNCLLTVLAISTEHLWSTGLSLPMQHIICVISLFTASSQWGLSWFLCIHRAMHQGLEEEEDEKASELLCRVFPVSFVSLFWKREERICLECHV